MELTAADIAEFKRLYKEKFNVDLNDQEARQQLSLLVRQMEIVYQPISKQQLDDLEAERKRDAKALAELAYDMHQEEVISKRKKA